MSEQWERVKINPGSSIKMVPRYFGFFSKDQSQRLQQCLTNDSDGTQLTLYVINTGGGSLGISYSMFVFSINSILENCQVYYYNSIRNYFIEYLGQVVYQVHEYKMISTSENHYASPVKKRIFKLSPFQNHAHIQGKDFTVASAAVCTLYRLYTLEGCSWLLLCFPAHKPDKDLSLNQELTCSSPACCEDSFSL